MPPSTTAERKVLSIPESEIKIQTSLNGVIQSNNTTLCFIKEEGKRENWKVAECPE